MPSPFYVPNVQAASDNAAPLANNQAELDAVDLQILSAAEVGTGVLFDGSGNYGAVTAQVSPNMTVQVASSTDLINGVARVVNTPSALTIVANSSGFPRFDLVVSDATAINFVIQGTPASVPDFPALTLDSNGLPTQVVKAAVWVINGATSIANTDIISKRMLLSRRSDALANHRLYV